MSPKLMVTGKTRSNRLILLVLRLNSVIILLDAFVSYVTIIDGTAGGNNIIVMPQRNSEAPLYCRIVVNSGSKTNTRTTPSWIYL